MSQLFRTALVALSVLVFSACSQTGVTPNPNLLDNKGGTVKSSDGNASLAVASQTLSSPVALTLLPSNQNTKPTGNKVLVSGTAYILSSTPQITLSKPSTLTLKYDPSVVQGLSKRLGVKTQAAANTLEVGHLVDNAWQVVTGSTADETNSTVQVPVTEMGTYALLAPDGSKPVWQLEVRGGIGAVDSTITQIGILAQTIKRDFLYIGLTRNGEAPTSPVALHVDGPNGYSGDLSFAAGNTWGVYGLSSYQAGTYTVQFSSDGQVLTAPVDIALTPTLPLPSINTQVTGSTVNVSWPAVEGAQNYEVRLYSSGLDILQVARTKNLTTTLTIPSGYSVSSTAVAVLAYSWDSTLERAQKYPSPPNTFNVSAGMRILSTSNPPPTGQPKLSNLSPTSLNLAAATGKTTGGSIVFSNTGTATLNYSASVSGSAFKVTAGATGSLYAYSGSGAVTVEGTCGATATTLNGTLTLTTDDPTAITTSIPLKLDCLATLTATQRLARIGHISQVSNIVTNSAGTQLASRDSSSGRLLLWNATTNRVSRSIDLSSSNCCYSDTGAMAYNADGTKLATVANSSTLIKIFNTSTGAELVAISGLSSYGSIVWNVAGTQIAALGNNNQIAIYDAVSGSLLKQYTVSDPNSTLSQILGFNSDGTRLLLNFTSYSTNTVRVIDADNGSQIATYDIPSNYYNARGPIALLSGNTQIVALAYDSTTSQYRFDLRTATTGTLVKSFGAFSLTGDSYRLAASPDGTNIALYNSTNYYTNVINVWNITAGTLTKSFSPPTTNGTFVGILAWVGNTSLALGYNSGLIRTVNASTGTSQNTLGYHTSAVSNISFDSTNTQILSGTTGSSYYSNSGFTTLAWANFTTDANVQRLYESATSIMTSRWYSTDTRIAAVVRTSSAFLLRSYNATTGAQLSSVSVSGLSDSSKLIFSPDGSKLLYSSGSAYSGSATASIVNSPDGTSLVSLSDLGLGSTTSVSWSFVWSSDGTKIYGAAGDNYSANPTVATWDASTGARISSVRLLPSSNSGSFYCSSMMFSGDGSRVLCMPSYSSSPVLVFNTANGAQVGQFTLSNAVTGYALDGTGSRILVVSNNRLEVLTTSGASLLSINLSTNTNSGTYTVAWSPNNKFIALGDWLGSLYVWELK